MIEDISFFETSGFSMWPFLKAGERVIIKKVPMQELTFGDIILYRDNNQMVCHRLVKKIRDGRGYLLYVRGDSSISAPELVTEEIFLGKAAGILKKNGKVVNLSSRWRQFINRLIVIGAPVTVRIMKPVYARMRNFLKMKVFR